jgi:hypothetical protein
VGEEEWFSVRDYLKLLATHAQAFRYMASPEELNFFEDGKWNESFATLRPDFAVPAYVPQSRPLHCGMWISPKGCRSRLHYDGGRVHNLNAQVMGTKHVTLYSPTMSAKLYNHQSTSGYLGHYSQVDVEDVDHQRFPLFSEVDGYEGILKSGDLLLIPTYWYHTFKHIGDFNVNVNFWWHAEFIRLTAASARDHCIGALLKTTSGSKIQQWRLRSWARRMERAILQSQ